MNAQLDLKPQFARESSGDVMGEIAPLLEDHWAEIAHYPDIPVAVNYEAYLKIEARGSLRIFTVRAPQLVGYAIFTVNHSLHYSSSLQARQDVLYLDPCYRKGRVGLAFIRWCDTQLQAEGVQVVFHHQKLIHAALGAVLDHLGYEPVDMIWQKRLDHGL